MGNSQKLKHLQEELQKTQEQKSSLRRTTREQYYVLNLLIDFYKKEITRYEKKYLLGA